jgi:hypothetical protein
MKAFTTLRHGHATRAKWSPTYMSWVGMIQRCSYPRHAKYSQYGGRGIVVCERWKLFDNFLLDMGERPKGKSLDRIDPNKNYEPGNCKWSTKSEQMRNTRRALIFDGKPLARWAEESGVSYQTLKARLRDQGTIYLKHGGLVR